MCRGSDIAAMCVRRWCGTSNLGGSAACAGVLQHRRLCTQGTVCTYVAVVGGPQEHKAEGELGPVSEEGHKPGAGHEAEAGPEPSRHWPRPVRRVPRQSESSAAERLARHLADALVDLGEPATHYAHPCPPPSLQSWSLH